MDSALSGCVAVAGDSLVQARLASPVIDAVWSPTVSVVALPVPLVVGANLTVTSQPAPPSIMAPWQPSAEMVYAASPLSDAVAGTAVVVPLPKWKVCVSLLPRSTMKLWLDGDSETTPPRSNEGIDRSSPPPPPLASMKVTVPLDGTVIVRGAALATTCCADKPSMPTLTAPLTPAGSTSATLTGSLKPDGGFGVVVDDGDG